MVREGLNKKWLVEFSIRGGGGGGVSLVGLNLKAQHWGVTFIILLFSYKLGG